VTGGASVQRVPKRQRTRVDGVLHRPPIVHLTILIFSYYYVLIVYYITHARARVAKRNYYSHFTRARVERCFLITLLAPQCHTACDVHYSAA